MSIFWIIIIVILIILAICFIILWYQFKYGNPYTLTEWLNLLIDEDRLLQNELDMKIYQRYLEDKGEKDKFQGISSYCLASESHNQLVRRLDADLVEQYDQIKKEILELLPTYSGLAMVDLDPIQKEAFQGKADEWKVIWVRFLDKWGQKANQVPTLKKIVEKYPKIILLHISVMAPGTILPKHEGISKAVIRYHLPIQVPRGEVYLKLDGKKIKWVEREGIVFDDCLPHSVMMKPDRPFQRQSAKGPDRDEYRILIFADIPREYDGSTGWLKDQICRKFHTTIQENKWLQQIKNKI